MPRDLGIGGFIESKQDRYGKDSMIRFDVRSAAIDAHVYPKIKAQSVGH